MKKSITLDIDTITGRAELSSVDSLGENLKEWNRQIQCEAAIPWAGEQNIERKRKASEEAGRFYRKKVAPFEAELSRMEFKEIAMTAGIRLEAADYTDPAGNLGTLSGSLVMTKALPLYAYEYPELGAMFWDVSSEPGLLNQTEDTRVVIQPAVQKYDSTTDAAGRPKGWDTVSPAKTLDVPVTLTDYVAVPIVFGANTLSATGRDLFGEQAEAAMKAIAGYATNMVTSLLTPANFSAYAAVTADNPQTVPVAYTTYARGLTDFSMTDLDKLSAIFTQNKVPRRGRGILLSTMYYARLRDDPRLELFFAAQAANPILTEQKLPDGLSGFFPYEAPYLPNTGNLAFFPFHKAGIVVKARTPQNFMQSLNTMVPGKVSIVTEPDTKFSVALVQYINLQQNYSESRPEVILGVSVGDNRGGLCGTTQ